MRMHIKMFGGVPHHAVEQPYYLKHVPMNPFLGSVHDGVSTGWRQGFSVKPIHWLYRFRHNYLPTGIPTGYYNRNPGGKNVHWLEVSNWEKFRLAVTNEEGRPPVLLSCAVIAITIWHLWRVIFFHPDLTLFNISLWSSKPWVEVFRANEKHPMDKPVWRWFQRCPEFYAYDATRDLIKLDIIANDPWIQHVKEIGRGDELVLHATERAAGNQGRGHLIPSAFEQKSSIWTPRSQH